MMLGMAIYDYGALRTALQRKVAAHDCPACGGSIWGGADVVLGLPVVDRKTANGQHIGTGKEVIVFPIICDRCGYMQCFQVGVLLEDG